MNKGENFVYLAGPIRNKWRILRWLNIWRGRCAAKKLNNAGFYVFCPHMNFATMGIGGKAEDHMVKQDLLWLEKCDFVVVIGDFKYSLGTLGELDRARVLGMKVYYGVEEAIANRV